MRSADNDLTLRQLLPHPAVCPSPHRRMLYLRPKQRGSVFPCLFHKGAGAPILDADSARERQVVNEDLHLPARELLIEDVQRRLIIEMERTVVEIGRPHGYDEIVDDRVIYPLSVNPS